MGIVPRRPSIVRPRAATDEGPLPNSKVGRMFPLVKNVLFVVLGLSVGCKSLEHAAQKDPMKCERDVACQKKQHKMRDCSAQCNDDPACMDRCRQGSADFLGKP